MNECGGQTAQQMSSAMIEKFIIFVLYGRRVARAGDCRVLLEQHSKPQEVVHIVDDPCSNV